MRVLLFISIILLLIRFYFSGRIFIIEDEAYYWFWANHLSWGYPEHPPLVAWLINIFKDLIPISPNWSEIQFFDVRLGGVVLSVLLFLVCYDWGFRIQPKSLSSPKTADSPLWVLPSLNPKKLSSTGTVFATLSQIIPYYYGAFFLITPDTPMVFTIFLTLYFYYRGIFEHHNFFYLGGIALGFSLLAKLTSLLPALGMLIFFITSPITRKELLNPRFLFHLVASVLIGMVIFLPYLLWNINYNFPVLNNLSRLMFIPVKLKDFVSFWGEQAILYFPLFLPFLIILPFSNFIKIFFNENFNNIDQRDETNLYQQKKYFLLWVSLLPLAYFFYKSTQSFLRINWMGSTFMGSTALFALWLTEQESRWRRIKPFFISIGIAFTLLISTLFYITDKKFAPLDNFKAELTQIYPKYEIFFESYLMYDFFQTEFHSFYKEHMNKNLPIVSHNYQIPSVVNYYLRPEREAFGIANTNSYHLMTYYFLPGKNYSKDLEGSYYLLLGNHQDPDKKVLRFKELGKKITEIKQFFIRKNVSGEPSGIFTLYLIE